MLKIFADDPNAEPPALLTKRGAAEFYSMSERTFQKLGIPPVKLPSGGIRYSRSTLLEWIEQHQAKDEPCQA